MYLEKLILQKLECGVGDPQWRKWLSELIIFGYFQALSCIFPAFIFLMLSVSHLFHIPYIERYDFLLIACILMQVYMYFSGMETKDELLVITLFHLLGLLMELHKVNVGSWSYPEFAHTKIYGVPLYSGFMYASVASYICQAWRRFSLNIYGWPKSWVAFIVGATIYLNFFTNAYMQDLRWFIIPVMLIVFYKTTVSLSTNGIIRKMPLVVSFLLIGFFIWLAENVATLLGAWKYAYQHKGWQMVSFNKITSWFLLIVVSIIIIAQLKRIKERLVE